MNDILSYPWRVPLGADLTNARRHDDRASQENLRSRLFRSLRRDNFYLVSQFATPGVLKEKVPWQA